MKRIATAAIILSGLAVATPTASAHQPAATTCPTTGRGWTSFDLSRAGETEYTVITDQREPIRRICHQAGSCPAVTVKVAPPRSSVYVRSTCIEDGVRQPFNRISVLRHVAIR